MDDTPEPKTQTESSGGNGPRRRTRNGAGTPGDSHSRRVTIDRDLSVEQLASKLGMLESSIVKELFVQERVCRTVQQIIEADLARKLANSLGFTVVD